MAARRRGGFDCEFVEQPPIQFPQLECPVCLQILREPYQASCCGNSFCLDCIEIIKNDSKPCPTCKNEQYDIFRDKRLRRSLYAFQVYCSHKQKGCEWKGELGQLDNHLNLSPQPDKQLEGCEYSEIECIYCSELIKRHSIAVHQTKHCDKRPFSCEYCHSYESTYEDVINNHWFVCGYHPILCPNACGSFLQRQTLENHVTKDCPETVIDCVFHHVGCNVKLPRKDMPAHLNENLVTHMSLQAASHSKLLASHKKLQVTLKRVQGSHDTLQGNYDSLHARHIRLQARHTTLQTKMEKIKQQFASNAGCVPCEFVMHNFEKHKEDQDRWISPSFYTHPEGYKFCLGVDANGRGVAFVSVYLYLMRGEFDDKLTWPFQGTVSIQLVDQTGLDQHCEKSITFDEESSSALRVLHGDKNKAGRGAKRFISHSEMRPSYCQDNQLHFRIIKVTLQ